MIELQHLTKKFSSKIAVNDLSLNINNGEIFGLLGPNGAGKSTTLKMITGILTPNKGDVLVDSFSIKKNPLEAKKNFGFVFDDPNMFLGMKGRDYLIFISSVFNIDKNTALQRIEDLSKQYHLDKELDNLIGNYSHGMRQKIFVIGALVHEPNNLILDEPLTGLDPEAAFELKNTMKEYAFKGHSVLFSTHVLEVAEKICDRIGIIANGKLLYVGSLDELRKMKKEENQSLEDLFLEITR